MPKLTFQVVTNKLIIALWEPFFSKPHKINIQKLEK